MSETFMILEASDPEQRREWLKKWSEWPSREVQAHPAYCELFAAETDRVVAATYSNETGHQVLYPFLLREVDSPLQDQSANDISTPYGYGGPASWGGELGAKQVTRFWELFDAWAKEENVVSEFIRYNLFHEDTLPYPGDKVFRQLNVVVQLDQPEETLWRSFESKVRKNVNRALREGVSITHSEDSDGLKDFLSIYLSTMDRRGASSNYYYSKEFFETLGRELSGQFAYFYAHQENRIISTELVLVSAHSIYSFLGGTNPDFFSSRPNELLKFEIMKWGQKTGKSHFVLGGGHSSGDGIERYKRSFAPESKLSFSTGQRILNQQKYASLSDSSPSSNSSTEQGFFPAYRNR